METHGKRTRLMRVIFLALFLFVSLANGQTKTWIQWESDFDQNDDGNFTVRNWSGLADYIAGPLKSNDISDMYWESFAIVNGYRMAWQGSGDFKYLDFVLDVIDNHIDNSEFYNTTNPAPQSDYQNWNFRFNPAKPNYFGLNTVSIPTYLNNADPDVYGYGRRTASPNLSSAGTYITLDEGMYYRNVANVMRVMHNNISDIGSLESNNGQTYQQRLNKLRDYVRDHVWARNFENPNVIDKHYAKEVYRVNVHMSSHLAMVALCLYVTEGDQKYRDFVEEFLWDFSDYRDPVRPTGTTARLPAGVGMMDKLEYQPASDSYWWVAKWEKNVGDMLLQDEGHAVAELQLIEACYEEGIGGNPPNGEPAIDLQLMQRLANSIQKGYLKGYVCADGQNEPSAAFRLDGSGFAYGLQSALQSYGQFNTNILCYLEARTSGIDLVRTGQLGAAIYVSSILGVGGEVGPAYSSTGSGGTPPSNIRPVVSPRAGSVVNATVGDPFSDPGADVSDFEDGSSFISSATSGSVPVDGSNNYSTAGTFVLTYSSTDSGGLTGSATTTYNISSVPADPPVLTLDNSTQTITLNGSYTPTTYSWTDAIDGGPFTTGAVIGGDTVDTGLPGIYNVTFTVTNASGLQDTATEVVTVVDNNIPVTGIVIEEPSLKFRMRNRSTDFVRYTIYPTNATNQRLEVVIADQTILEDASPNELSYQFLSLKRGTTNVTLRTVDGGFEQTVTVIVDNPGSIFNVIVNQ